MVKNYLCKLLTVSVAIAVSCGATLLAATGMASAAETLVIESWRNDDIDIWNDKIIPAFNKRHPDIEVVFSPTQSSR